MKNINPLRNLISVSIILILTVQSSLYSQLICRANHIENFLEESETGHQICGGNTSNMSKTRIYITVKDNNLYVHSNYVTPGYENPTKMYLKKSTPFDIIAQNIFFDRPPNLSNSRIAQIEEIIENMDVILDPSFINSGYSSIQLSNPKRVKILCPDGSIRESNIITNKSGIKEYLVKYNDQFSARIKGQNLDYIFEALGSHKMKLSDTKILSLSDNSATKRALSSKFRDQQISFDFSNPDNFEATLLLNRFKRIIILGHIENGAFVTIAPNGRELFRITIDEIQGIQKRNNLQLILLGCNSAAEGANSGTITKFNSIDILNRLEKTKQTGTIEEFLDSLAFKTIHFVLDNSFFYQSADSRILDRLHTQKAELLVYNRPEKNAIKNLPLGSITLLGIADKRTLDPAPPGSEPDTEPNPDPEIENPDDGNNDGMIGLAVIGGLILLWYIFK